MMKVVLVLVALIGTACALECFSCNSYDDPACGDEFQANSTALQNAFIETCVLEEAETEDGEEIVPFCRKMAMDIEVVYTANEKRIQRGCATKRKGEGESCYQKRSEDYVTTVCQCDTDLCNGSPSLSFASLVALALPFLARVF